MNLRPRTLDSPSHIGLSFRIILIALAAFLMTLPSALLSQWKNLPEKTAFKNGLTVITQTDGASTVTVLELLIKGGKKAEPAGLEGISFLTTRLALEIPDQSKVQELMEKSTRYMMTSRGDWSAIHIECLSENLDSTLRIVIQILKDPLFSGIRIDRNKDSMNNARKMERDDNINLGHLAQLGAFFRGAGYDGSVYGQEDSLKKIRGRDVQSFFGVRFLPDNMILVAVSDLDSPKLIEILQKHFGSLPPRTKVAASPSPVQSDAAATQGGTRDLKDTLIEKETKQALVSAGFLLPPVSARNYALATLLENLLGRGPGSRLWRLRSDEKLAYNVSAQMTIMKDAGMLETFLETDSAKQGLARAALTKKLGEFYEQGVAADELVETKALLRANYLRTNETKDRRAATLGSYEALGLGYDFFLKYPQELNAVTLEEINAFVREYLSSEKAHFVTVGPLK